LCVFIGPTAGGSIGFAGRPHLSIRIASPPAVHNREGDIPMSAQTAAGTRFPVKVAVALVLACGTEPKPNIDGVWTGGTEDRTDPWTLEITNSNDRHRGT